MPSSKRARKQLKYVWATWKQKFDEDGRMGKQDRVEFTSEFGLAPELVWVYHLHFG